MNHKKVIWWERRSKFYFALGCAATLLFTSGCVTPSITKSKCRHDSFFTAVIDSEHYPVRIWVGTANGRKGTYHGQSQAKINDKWEWRERWYTEVRTVKNHHNWFVPQYILTMDDWWESYKRVWVKYKNKGRE